MSVIEKAKELALTIIETEEYKKLKEAEVVFEADTKSKELMDEYNKIQSTMLEELKKDSSKEYIDEIKKSLMDKQKEINDYAVTKEFLLARSGFEAMMQQVNQVIAFVVSGEEGCTDEKCASCAGCAH